MFERHAYMQPLFKKYFLANDSFPSSKFVWKGSATFIIGENDHVWTSCKFGMEVQKYILLAPIIRMGDNLAKI
jgi:hypothetical protein